MGCCRTTIIDRWIIYENLYRLKKSTILMLGDLNIFEGRDYMVGKVKIIDIFPRTMHVETVVLMSRVEK